MAILSPIIKKYHEKIDEYRDINALVEQAKAKHHGIVIATQRQLNTISKREEELQVKTRALEKERQAFNDSIDRTHLKLSDSVEELNKRAMQLNEDIKEKANFAENLDYLIQQSQNVLTDLDAELKKRQAKLDMLSKERQVIVDDITRLNTEKDNKQQIVIGLEKRVLELGMEEQQNQQRRDDLEIYAKRIKQLYKEQDIDLDI